MSRPGRGEGERRPRHLDKFGHVTGLLLLHGEEITIDCYAMRDRSWWHLRPEPWKTGGGTGSYITAAASPDTAFFGCGPGGFLVLDGVPALSWPGSSGGSAIPSTAGSCACSSTRPTRM
jgi:hypothetical protein